MLLGVLLSANSSMRFESSYTFCSSGAMKNADAGTSCDEQKEISREDSYSEAINNRGASSQMKHSSLIAFENL